MGADQWNDSGHRVLRRRPSRGAGQGGSNQIAALRFQALAGTGGCNVTTGWTAPRPIACSGPCPSGGANDVHAIALSPIDPDGRLLVAIQLADGGQDELALSIIDLRDGSSQSLTPSGPHRIDPGNWTGTRYPFSIGATLLDDDSLIAVAVTQSTTGGLVGTRAWRLPPGSLTLDAPDTSSTKLRWLRVHSTGNRVLGAGINNSNEPDGVIFNFNTTTTGIIDSQPVGWARSRCGRWPDG